MDEEKEVIRKLLTDRYNDRTGGTNRLDWTKKNAKLTIQNSLEFIRRENEKIQMAEMSIGLLSLAEQYHFELWDLSDNLPKDEGTFVGTDKEFIAKARELGLPEVQIKDYIEQNRE